jgi:hypothetical protein
MFPFRYEFGLYIPEDSILHSHNPENLKAYIGRHKIATVTTIWTLTAFGLAPFLCL